jgi:seryl-tRNA synthetase
MGPCFISTEGDGRMILRSHQQRLQWGRASSARKACFPAFELLLHGQLQWGRASSARKLADFHSSSAAAGFTDADTRGHVKSLEDLAAAMESAKQLPSAEREMKAAQAELVKLDSEIEELAERRKASLQRNAETSAAFADASSAAGKIASIDAHVAELFGE